MRIPFDLNRACCLILLGALIAASSEPAAGENEPYLVTDINVTGGSQVTPQWLVEVDGVLFFSGASDNTYGIELWKSDGTAAGTVLVRDIWPGENSSSPRFLASANGRLFFRANDGTHGDELWTSDGTAAGTVIVRDILPGAESSNPFPLANVNGTLFFAAYNDTSGGDLWKSDGTAAGTVLVHDVWPESGAILPDGTLLFVGYDDAHGYEIWKSDGTAAGTVLVRDIWPGENSSITAFPPKLTDVNGTVFFTADDGIRGKEIWKSDGTAAGTVIVRDILPGPNSPSPQDLTDVNGTIFFSAFHPTYGVELWKTDGTAGGTVLVRDIRPGSSNSFPNNSYPWSSPT